MTITVEMIITFIGVLSGVCGLVFGFNSQKTNKQQQDDAHTKDAEQGAEKTALMISDIEYIKKGVDDIVQKIGTLESTVVQHSTDIVRFDVTLMNEVKRTDKLESSLSALHKRLDRSQSNNWRTEDDD